MEYTITALTNDRARLIVSSTRTDKKVIADMVAAAYAEQGHIVIWRIEE